jgi:glycine/D-amino acid oxidase-like deaminating enzyme/nitrite reductase/ring-hydroxylating ferredoxin subunit
MKRDGAQKSLWQDSVADFTPQNNWNKDTIYDVLIVGGGITGCTTALLLQSNGLNCILAEAGNIGFGTTGGTTAHLNTFLDTTYPEIESKFSKDDAKLVARGARESIDLIEGLLNKYSIDCEFSYRTGYLIAQNEDEEKELKKIREATERAGVVVSKTDNVPILLPFTEAIRVEMQAQIHPTCFIEGLAKAYQEHGGVLLQQCLVQKTERGDYFIADTSLGEIKARRIVYATHVPPGITLFSFRCAPYRSYAIACTLPESQYTDGLVYDLKEPYHYFRTQEIEGKKYLVAGGFDHKTGHNDNTEYTFTELEAFVRKYYDVQSVDYKWSSQYYVPSDGLPYIGLMPGEDSIYVATGYNGNGMVLGPLAAKIICELITNNESIYEKVFKPGRIKPIAGFTEFVKENADVVSKFIGMRFSYQKVEQLAQLAPGEALLADWENKKVALYKDETGHIHALDPVCPHAGCLVAWNNAEKSWDCPCHGGRYACNGALLTGPARRGLEQIKWEDLEGD